MTISQGSLPLRILFSEDVLVQQLGDEYVLLNVVTEKYFGLDEVGARFWELLSEDGDTQNALAVVGTEYNVSPETLANDLQVFIDQLLVEKLVQVEYT